MQCKPYSSQAYYMHLDTFTVNKGTPATKEHVKTEFDVSVHALPKV